MIKGSHGIQKIRAVLFTRFPVPGKAKTRLIPALGSNGAAAVHKILTERSIFVLQACDCQLEIGFTGAPLAEFQQWLGDKLSYCEQHEGNLSDRLISLLTPSPVLFFGSDTPDLSKEHVDAAIEALKDNDVVIGPAEDGGYYCIGVNEPYAFLFEEMNWGTDQVLPTTLTRIAQQNLSFVLLEELRDCDRPDDLFHWPWLTEVSRL